MLYRFRSGVTADLVLLPETARRILLLWNKPPEGPGILLLDQMPEARAVLVQEAEREAHEREQVRASAVSHGQTPAPTKSIPFATRIHPLLQVLDTCMKEEADLTW